jgi:hypothetical protein
MSLQDQIGTLTAAIAAVEGEIVKISSKYITESEIEKLGSYSVPAPYQDLLKKNNRFPAPPFSAVTGRSKSEIPPSPRSRAATRGAAVADEDVSSLASSTVRRSRRGKTEDDAESTDTRSTRRSARSGRVIKDDESVLSTAISAASPKAGGRRKNATQQDASAASTRSMRPSKRKAEQPPEEPATRQSSRRRK